MDLPHPDTRITDTPHRILCYLLLLQLFGVLRVDVLVMHGFPVTRSIIVWIKRFHRHAVTLEDNAATIPATIPTTTTPGAQSKSPAPLQAGSHPTGGTNFVTD